MGYGCHLPTTTYFHAPTAEQSALLCQYEVTPDMEVLMKTDPPLVWARLSFYRFLLRSFA